MESLESFYSSHGPYLWTGLAIFALLVALWMVWLQLSFHRLLRHYRSLTSDLEAGSLDEVLTLYLEQARRTAQRVEELGQTCHQLEGTLRRAIQRVAVKRFNPFPYTGGDQSFTTALLDAQGDGLVLSSLFNRTETRTFAKPIQGGRSQYNLSEEEKEVIQAALAGEGAIAGKGPLRANLPGRPTPLP